MSDDNKQQQQVHSQEIASNGMGDLGKVRYIAPEWACRRWGGFEHEWQSCQDCLQNKANMDNNLRLEWGRP